MPGAATDRRLTLSDAREIIPERALSDSGLETLIDQMYSLADIAMSEFARENGVRSRRSTVSLDVAKAA